MLVTLPTFNYNPLLLIVFNTICPYLNLKLSEDRSYFYVAGLTFLFVCVCVWMCTSVCLIVIKVKEMQLSQLLSPPPLQCILKLNDTLNPWVFSFSGP